MWDPSQLGCGFDDTQETRFLARILASQVFGILMGRSAAGFLQVLHRSFASSRLLVLEIMK